VVTAVTVVRVATSKVREAVLPMVVSRLAKSQVQVESTT
jgi:hypothetical protein